MATTQKRSARAPRKPTTGRKLAKAAAAAKPNPFDDIARQVIADQEAKDRAAGRDDLTSTLAKSIAQAKVEQAAKPTKPARPAKPATPAKPVKPMKLRAPAKAPAKAKAAAKPKQRKPDKAPTITLGHVWGDKKPDWLYRCTLVTRYEVRTDGTVWSTLDQVLGSDGKVVEDFWRLPLDFRPTQEVAGNGRKVNLRNRTIAGLQAWLIREGLTTAQDIGGSDAQAQGRIGSHRGSADGGSTPDPAGQRHRQR